MSTPPTGPRRRGLGRGLDALLSSPSHPSTSPEQDDPRGQPHSDVELGRFSSSAIGSPTVVLREIDPAQVEANPEQPRQHFDAEGLHGLTESIRLHGVLQPIVVERHAGGYRLIAGERRLKACRAAPLSSIPAIIRPAAESARQSLELALTENLARADLTPLEEATAYARLSDTFGLSHEAIALRVGRSRATVTNTIRLLGVAPAVQAHLRAGVLSAGHARALLPLPEPIQQERLAERAIAEQLSVRQIERQVQGLLDATVPTARGAATTAPAAPPVSLTPDDQALQRGFEAALGAPVRLERRRHGGRVVIDFYSDDELDGLYRRVGGSPP